MSCRALPLLLLVLVFDHSVLPGTARADLVFSEGNGTARAYFSAVASSTGPCQQLCGLGTNCWALTSQSAGSVRMWTDYQGPGPCPYCGCCMEAAAMSTGVIRIILFVDPVTGLPRAPAQGGVPVKEGIPAGARLSMQSGAAWLATANAGIASYCDNTCYSGAFVAFEGTSVAESQARPITGDGPYLYSIPLQGNGAGFLSSIAAKANRCSWAIAEVRFYNPTVTVPGNTLFPPAGALGTDDATITVKWTNLSAGPVYDLDLTVYDPEGVPIDSLQYAEVGPFQELQWTVSGASRRSTVRALGLQSEGYAVPYPASVRCDFAHAPIAPHIMAIDSNQNPNTADVFLQAGSRFASCRLGTLSFAFDTGAPDGVAVVGSEAAANVSDGFDTATLDPAWVVVNQSSPQSTIGLTARPGFLTIKATATGDGADLAVSTNTRAPRVLQSVDWQADWEMETRLEFAPSDNYEGAGILVNGSIIAERGYSPSNGGSVVRAVAGWQAGFTSPVTYFKLVKAGSDLTGYYSSDGSEWVLGGTTSAPSDGCIGLFCRRKNYVSGNDHDAVAEFDYVNFSNGLSGVGAAASAQITRAAPNPMSRATTFFVDLPSDADVEVLVYDVRGRRIRRIAVEGMSSGPQQVHWNGRDDNGRSVAAGAYFYKVRAGSDTWSGKIALLR